MGVEVQKHWGRMCHIIVSSAVKPQFSGSYAPPLYFVAMKRRKGESSTILKLITVCCLWSPSDCGRAEWMEEKNKLNHRVLNHLSALHLNPISVSSTHYNYWYASECWLSKADFCSRWGFSYVCPCALFWELSACDCLPQQPKMYADNLILYTLLKLAASHSNQQAGGRNERWSESQTLSQFCKVYRVCHRFRTLMTLNNSTLS